MALSVDEGRRLLDAAISHDRILQVGHLLEYHPAIAALKARLAEGRLGKLCHVHTQRLNFGKIRSEEDAVWSLAPHDISVILRLAGTMPGEVSCFGSFPLRTPRADSAMAHLRFDSGVDARFLVSWLNPTKEQKVTVIGDQAMAVFDDVSADRKLTIYDQRANLSTGQTTLVKGLSAVEILPPDEPLQLECKAFVKSMETRAAPLADGLSGLRVLAVLEACRRSMESNKPVNPVTSF
jgi:UDP-2-acetamido-3-amino-2,3-dideoxy-glucuronate N-acetyltransferase